MTADATETASLTFVDLSGRVAAKKIITGGKAVSLENLMPGIYISLFEHNGNMLKEKVAVTR